MAQDALQEKDGFSSGEWVSSLGRGDRLRTLYIVATCLLAAIVPLILFAGLWVQSELHKNKRETEQFLRIRATQLASEIDTQMSQQFAMLGAIAALPSIDRPDLAAFHEDADRIQAVLPQWAFLSLSNPETGEQLLNTRVPFGTVLPKGDEDVVRRVAQTRMPAARTHYVNAPDVDDEGGVQIYVPVIRNNDVRYVLSAALKFDAIQKLVEPASNTDLLVGVVDENGKILARSSEILRFRGVSAATDVRAATRGRELGTFTGRTLEGSVHLNAFRRSPQSGWVAIAGADQQSLDGLAARSTMTLALTGALSISLAAVLAVVLVYNMVQRRVTSERIAASQVLGDLQTKLLAKTQEALEDQSKAASEREVLLRELYHRVKNNLQIIQSLLRLGARNLSPDQREPFETAVRRIGAMARVHTLLYNSPDLASIDLKDYLEDIVNETSEGFGADARGIRTNLDAQQMRVPLDTAIPLAFIVVEILANAYKHAFPDGKSGFIDIKSRLDGEQGIITISDDGIGLPKEIRKNNPLGLNLVSKLVEQIGGTMEAPEPGHSNYRVVFPLTEKEPLPEHVG